MKKVIVAIVMIIGLSGCSYLENVTPENISTTYGNAKVIYQDTKHIVYEIENEVKRVEKDGFSDEKRD